MALMPKGPCASGGNGISKTCGLGYNAIMGSFKRGFNQATKKEVSQGGGRREHIGKILRNVPFGMMNIFWKGEEL